MSFSKALLSFTLFTTLALTGCGEKRDEWHKLPKANFAIPPYARYLDGTKICLDPGHGGQAHLPNYKRGSAGLREAEVNLRVALYLRKFLREAGAIVLMTRTDDSFVSIPDRSELANQNAVDFFISIHHNSATDPKTNNTSTWYHRDADDSPADLDLARYVQQGVAEALRLPNFPPTGLYSDQLVVPSGFGVLRLTKPTAILCEASFYSHPEEERRLQQESYNRREAYGYFLGMARYVAAGFPKGVLLTPSPESSVETKTPRIQIRVMDGLHARGAWMLKRQQVFSDSIRVKLDGVIVPHQYLRGKDLIVVKPKKPLSNGVHFVETDLINYYGNHNLPGDQWFKVAPPAARLKLRAWTKALPPDAASYVGITVTALDKDSLSITDDEPIHAETSLGRLADAVQPSKNGEARFYLHTDATQPEPGVARVKVAYKGKSEVITIRFGEIRGGIVQGAVRDVSGNAVADAVVRLVHDSENLEPPLAPPSKGGELSPPLAKGRPGGVKNFRHAVKEKGRTTTTNPEGHFFFDNVPPGGATLNVSKVGYYDFRLKTEAVSNSARIVQPTLHPIADGALIGQVFVLDARYGGSERGAPVTNFVTAADLNLAVVKALKEMLEIAGASVYLVREKDEKISVTKRVKAVNTIKQEGYYLRIDHGAWVEGEPSVLAAGYPGNQVAENYLKAILADFNTVLFKTPIETVGDKESPEIRWTNKPALALEIRSINHPHLHELPDSPSLISREAYAIFLGTWQFLKDAELIQTQLEVQVVDLTSRKPVAGASVTLDDTFPLVTDSAGKAVFRGIQARRYRVVVQAAEHVSQEVETDVVNRKALVVEVRK